MQEVFQPTHQEDQLSLYIGIFLAVAGAIGLYLSLRKRAAGRAYTRNMLLAMLLFFLTIISAGTAFFSWWSMQKIGPVSITADTITTPYGEVAFNDIRKAEIIADQPVRLIPSSGGQGAVKLLVIEEQSGKAHVLSEENYDIQRIFGALREAMR